MEYKLIKLLIINKIMFKRKKSITAIALIIVLSCSTILAFGNNLVMAQESNLVQEDKLRTPPCGNYGDIDMDGYVTEKMQI